MTLKEQELAQTLWPKGQGGEDPHLWAPPSAMLIILMWPFSGPCRHCGPLLKATVKTCSLSIRFKHLTQNTLAVKLAMSQHGL